MSRLPWLAHKKDALFLELFVQPKSSKDEFAGLHDGRLRVRIMAPPVNGKANAYLCAFLAKVFKVSKSQVSIVAGETNRRKRVRVEGMIEVPAVLSAWDHR